MRLYYPNSATLATKLTAALKDTLTAPTAKTETLALTSSMAITPDAAGNIFLLLDYTPSRSAAVTVTSGGTSLTMVEYRAGVALTNGQAAIDYDNSVLALNVWHKTNNKVISVTYTGVKTELDLCTLKALLEHLINTSNPHGDTLENTTSGFWKVNSEGRLWNVQNNVNFEQDGHAYIAHLQGLDYSGNHIGTWDGLEKSTVTGHINSTANPHGVTLPQLTGGSFSYADGKILDSSGGYWSGGDGSAAFDILTVNVLMTDNPIVNNTLTQKNVTTTPTTYFEQLCGSSGLPEFFRKTPADSVPVNVGSPFMTGLHWGVADNTPIAKLTVSPPANTSFASMDYINPTGAIRADEISFASNAVSHAVFPSALVSGAIYRISAGVRFYQAAGGTAGTHTLNLYLLPDTLPFGQWTRTVTTSASDLWQLIDLTFKVVDFSATQFALVINANAGGRPDYHVIAKTAVPEFFFSLVAASGNTYGTHITMRTSHLEVYRIK